MSDAETPNDTAVTTDAEPVILSVEIDAAPEVVWAALRDASVLREWHGWQYEGLEAEIEQFFFAPSTVEDAAARTLTLGSGDRFEVAGVDRGGRPISVLFLTRGAVGTLPELDEWRDAITEGWLQFLQQLRFHLELHRGDTRTTVRFDGSGACGQELVDDVSAARSADADPGAVELPSIISTSVWHESADQLTLTVAEWGPGLLWVGRVPGRSAGVQLTTYGVDAAVGDELAERWRQWWERASGC